MGTVRVVLRRLAISSDIGVGRDRIEAVDRLMAGLAGETRMALGVAHQAVFARLVDGEGNTALTLDEGGCVTVGTVGCASGQPVVAAMGRCVIGHGGSAGRTFRQFQRSDVDRRIGGEGHYIDVAIHIFVDHRAIALEGDDGDVGDQTLLGPGQQDA